MFIIISPFGKVFENKDLMFNVFLGCKRLNFKIFDMKNSPLSGKVLIQLIVLVVFFSSNFFSASAQQKVVGGIDVDIKDYPWQVAVDYGCGGSIIGDCLLYTSPSPRDMRRSRMPSSA